VVEIYDLLMQLFLCKFQISGFNLYYLKAFIHPLKIFVEALVYASQCTFFFFKKRCTCEALSSNMRTDKKKKKELLVRIHLKYYLQAT
jgi:hypothetical protein